MRVLFVILLLANAGFAAWAAYLGRPAEPLAARDISHLQRLVLTREASGAAPASRDAASQSSGPASAPAVPASP